MFEGLNWDPPARKLLCPRGHFIPQSILQIANNNILLIVLLSARINFFKYTVVMGGYPKNMGQKKRWPPY